MVKTSDFDSENSGSSPGEAAMILASEYFKLTMLKRWSAREEEYKGEVDMNSPRQNLTTTLKEWDEGFSCPLAEFIEELKAILDAAPQEARDKLRLNFDRYGGDYDTSRGELSVYYERPENDEELEQRLRREMSYKLSSEDRERQQYEALKAKFG